MLSKLGSRSDPLNDPDTNKAILITGSKIGGLADAEVSPLPFPTGPMVQS